MKTSVIVLLVIISQSVMAQSADREEISKVCMDYMDAFYYGDTAKLIRSFRPSVYKFGHSRDKTTGTYRPYGQMTYAQAMNFSRNVLRKKTFARADAPKKVEVLDVMDHIAAAKITAWWGVDYLLLSKDGGRWMIEQVLWEGPLETITVPK